MRGGWDRSTAGLALLALGLCLGGIATAVARSTAPSAAVRDTIVASRPAVPAQEGTRGGTPVRVRIPAIGVDAEMGSLGLNTDGTLEVPPYEEAGWYAGGSRPGDPGPAVIAAHLASTDGPAVFYRLEELNPGDVVHVGYRDGTVTFTVSETRSFAKTHFPTGRVYGWTEGPELRLVTCGGTFDRNTGAYTSNLVVWAKVEASA